MTVAVAGLQGAASLEACVQGAASLVSGVQGAAFPCSRRRGHRCLDLLAATCRLQQKFQPGFPLVEAVGV